MFKSRIMIVKSVKFPKDDLEWVEFQFEDKSYWDAPKLKDFWKKYNKENKRIEFNKVIKKGTKVRIWTIGWSQIVGFEIKYKGKWVSVWCIANNFRTEKQEEKDDRTYCDFIKNEGNLVAKLIDKRKTLREINKLVSTGHSLYTYSCVLSIGIKNAKNRKYAEKIKAEYKRGVI